MFQSQLFALAGEINTPAKAFLNSQLAAESEAKPVGCIVAQQNEVNHRCEQEKENTLSHEDATRVEYQPDFVKLCHVLYSPFTKRTKAV